MSTHSDDTRSALVEAALFCFSEFGFDGTSIRMIAKRAERPLSLIGHHFGCKDGLYLEVFKSLFKPFAAKGLGDEQGSTLAPRDRNQAVRQLREQIHLLYTEVCPGQGAVNEMKVAGRRLWLLEMRAPRPEVLDLLKQTLSPWVDRVRACLRVLRPDLTESEITFLGTTILGQVSGHGLVCGISNVLWGVNELSPFKSAEMITEFTLLGLGIPQNID